MTSIEAKTGELFMVASFVERALHPSGLAWNRKVAAFLRKHRWVPLQKCLPKKDYSVDFQRQVARVLANCSEHVNVEVCKLRVQPKNYETRDNREFHALFMGHCSCWRYSESDIQWMRDYLDSSADKEVNGLSDADLLNENMQSFGLSNQTCWTNSDDSSTPKKDVNEQKQLIDILPGRTESEGGYKANFVDTEEEQKVPKDTGNESAYCFSTPKPMATSSSTRLSGTAELVDSENPGMNETYLEIAKRQTPLRNRVREAGMHNDKEEEKTCVGLKESSPPYMTPRRFNRTPKRDQGGTGGTRSANNRLAFQNSFAPLSLGESHFDSGSSR